MNIGQAIEARGEARGEARAIQHTRHAIAMLKRGTAPEQVAKETHLDIEMILFLRDNMLH
ncbi:MAG: hypothetical protein ACK4PR_03375 [Gammaproteobacteria bacterium]